MTFDDLDTAPVRALRQRLETFYDAVPRRGGRAEDFGSLTLFVREVPGPPLYARPTLGYAGPVTGDDVRRVLARQAELGLPRAFEWVAETTPSLRAHLDEAGLAVEVCPLMVLDASAGGLDRPVDGPAARMIGPDDPDLAAAVAVPQLAFGEPGTAVGTAGATELADHAAALTVVGGADRIAGRLRDGLTRLAAVVEDGVVLSAGQHQAIGSVSEIVGVGTLPAARRRGLGRTVTAALAADALAGGAETVFLTAGGDDVARIYATIGFVRVGTGLIAEDGQ